FVLSLFHCPHTPVIDSLSLHDALPILVRLEAGSRGETWLIADLAEPGLYRIQALGPELVRMIVRDGGLGQVSEMQYGDGQGMRLDRKSTRLNSSHVKISYAVFCLKKKK